MSRERVCAGIILFNPDIDRLELVLSSIENQVEEVFAVDNNSKNSEDISRLFDSHPKVKWLKNEVNKGISKALNQACCEAFDRDYNWILTLDQDTICPSNMVDTLLYYTAQNNIGIVCPAVYYEDWGKNTQNERTDREEVYACMTSGSLIRLRAWKDVGGYDETYFMDYVDNEFCMKLRLSKYKILKVNRCLMSHQLGQTRIITIFGKKFVGITHSPLRCYDMMRNNLCFIRKYKNNLNLFREYGKVFSIFINKIFYSRNKKDTIKALLMGVRDGFSGKNLNCK